jgi:CxxC motif-containing protein (DUF1111 family)
LLRSLVSSLAAASALGALPATAAPPDSGGATTVRIVDASAFSLPAANLPMTRLADFFAGNSFFTNAWVRAPASASARDGLGPLFNTNSCQSCHLKDGRGRPPEPGAEFVSLLVRASVPARTAAERALERTHGTVPEPRYGDQIQNRAVEGVAREARAAFIWRDVPGRFADGTPYTLVRPALELGELGYGPLDPEVRLSARVAPPLVGMGLLERIPEAAIAALADPDDRDGNGISGRANRVYDVALGEEVLGRFGWKAGQPRVRQLVAAAFRGDLGITSRLFPEQPCTDAQTACARAPAGGSPELSDEVLDLVTFYAQTLGVPARRNPSSARPGEALFRTLGCADCHVERFVTGPDSGLPLLAGQEIHPYTDLLLHDMGEDLADGRPEFAADGREWRTPPLWGIGLVRAVSRHTRFLHDGRARNLEEAILWHGGEAEPARRAYAALARSERDQLLFFLDSL